MVEADLEIALPSEKPKCAFEVLSQMQKVCELDVIVCVLIERNTLICTIDKKKNAEKRKPKNS